MKKFLEKRYTRKQGIGGLLILLVAGILTFTVNTTMYLSCVNNLKYLANTSLYFCGNKAAVSLYNTHTDSGTYSKVDRVLRDPFNLSEEFKSLMKQAYPLSDANLSGTSVSIEWHDDPVNPYGIVRSNGFDTDHYGHITPNELQIVIEK